MKHLYLLAIISIISIIAIPSVSGNLQDERQLLFYNNNDNWGIGDDLIEGDYFEYRICGENLATKVITPHHCFDVQLTFVAIMESSQGMVWVVQGMYSDVVNTRYMIFQIDTETFEIITDSSNRELGWIIEDTIFSLSQYKSKSLTIGTQWGDIDSYFTQSVPFEIKREQQLIINNSTYNTSVLGYDVVIESNIFIDNNLPFPIKGEVYSPRIIYPNPELSYYYELMDYSTKR